MLRPLLEEAGPSLTQDQFGVCVSVCENVFQADFGDFLVASFPIWRISNVE